MSSLTLSRWFWPPRFAMVKVGCLLAACFCFALSSVHAQTQAEMNAQARADFQRADADLNKTYQSVLAKLPTVESKQKLREAQRAWVVSRDAEAAPPLRRQWRLDGADTPLRNDDASDSRSHQRIEQHGRSRNSERGKPRQVTQQHHRHQRLNRRANKRNRFPKPAGLRHRARAPFRRTTNGNTNAMGTVSISVRRKLLSLGRQTLLWIWIMTLRCIVRRRIGRR